MGEPYNYNIDVADPMKSFASGIESGLKQQGLQQQIEQQRVIKDAYAKLKSPNATAQDYANLSMMLPETQAKAVRESFTMLSDERKNAALLQSGQVFSAFKSGKPEIAIGLIEKQAEARRNSGDEEGAKFLETWRDVAKESPKTAEDFFGFTMAQIPGGDKVITSAISLSKEGREAEQGPAALIEANAKADKAVADAESARAVADTAEEKADADLKLAKAKADQADIQAKFEERNQKANLKKLAADFGLTTAQTNEVFVKTRNLGIEGKKAALELEAFRKTGGVDPDKKFQQEEKIRKEYLNRTGKYKDLGSTFENIKVSASSANGPGDIALITSFMKMLDPGSVVRETEFATGRDTAGLYANLQNQLQKAQNGQFLNATQRQQYVNLSQKYLDSAQKDANKVKESYGNLIKDYSLNPENVFGVDSDIVTINGKTYTRPPAFTDEQWTAYKKSQGG
jgi:hypothetical protein